MKNAKITRAKEKVKKLKNWYFFIILSTVGSVVMLWFSFKMQDYGAPEFVSWIYRLIPVVWLVLIVLQGLGIRTSLPWPFKSWEERQIRKFMKEKEIPPKKYR